jgi:hypothetical protein
MAKVESLTLATKYDWYEKAVQNPSVEVDFMRDWFKNLRGRKARILREDFCGTGAISCEWVRTDSQGFAHGIDLDAEPIMIGRERHWSKLSPKMRARMIYHQGNVMDEWGFQTDVICAFNFSYFIFKTRTELLNYFRKVRSELPADGLFFIDLFGGPESQKLVTDKRKIKDLTYYWECVHYNPITANCRFAIHFKKADRPVVKNVFTYDWRLWTLPELREILKEAGFSKTKAFWEGDDDQGGGNGEYEPTEEAENCDAWVSYIIGIC